MSELLHRPVERVTAALGGHSKALTVALLAAVLALDSADRGAVGVLAPSLKSAFSLSNTDIGLLSSVVSIVGAVATLPAGVLTDRVRRTTLLAVSVATWAVAMALSSIAVSFLMLVLTRVFLGAVTATSGPTASSLTGDLYPPRRRGWILGWIDSGELAGLGIGYLLVGAVIAVLSWRWVFVILGAIGAALVLPLWHLPEPPRGVCHQEEANRAGGPPSGRSAAESPASIQIARAHVDPDRRIILRGDETDMSLWEAVRYVLRVRTNVIVILASSVGYFFLAGLKVFAIVFAVHQYGLTQSTSSVVLPIVGVGGVVGLIAGGRFGDALLARGVLNARLFVAAAGFGLAAAMALPAVLVHSLAVAAPLLVVGGIGLGAPNPPMDAVRLDIIHPALWGRAEAIRTVLRTGGEALAPLLWGFLADHLGGGGHHGLQLTMLIMLPALVANGGLLLLATRTYPTDVASVHASLQRSGR
jgi:MFS family permease